MREYNPATQIITEADRCVACGLCLPSCPTYRQSADENESPRGRIALLRAHAQNILPATSTLTRHIDSCLDCRACESVCPSTVRYGQILQDGRALLARNDRHYMGHLYRLLLTVTQWPRAIAALYKIVRPLAAFKNGHFFPQTRRPTFFGLPPAITAPLPKCAHKKNPAVSLFLGCTRHIEGDTLNATIQILDHLGLSWDAPLTQGCCGALARHGGATALARRQEQRNMRAFKSHTTPLIGVASGCTAALKNYDPKNATQFPSLILDVHRFLAEHAPLERLELRPSHQTIAVHDPCSLRNPHNDTAYVYALLARIPGARIMSLPSNNQCCGAAGDYFLRHPLRAQALREPVISHIRALKPDIIVSANIGCRLHLAAGIAAADLTIPIVHPLVIIAQHLQTQGQA